MFKIEENQIYLTRGDKAVINLSIEDYTFKQGDRIEFRVYEEKKLKNPPVLSKTIIVEKETQTIDIELSSSETKIGDISSTTKKYWYEVELNNELTVLGYDEDGAKILTLYPEGAEEDDKK